MVEDFFYIISRCVDALGGGTQSGYVLLSLLLGALCWVVCSYYTRLWNKKFRVKLRHHLLCGMAAFFTVIFTIQFRAVSELEYIVYDIIFDWHEKLKDSDFNSETYEKAFYDLKEVYPSAFRGIPEPHQRGSVIPFASDNLMQDCVEIYVTEACANFSTMHPFLNLMLEAQPGISQEEIEYDIKDFFRKNPGATYLLDNAVNIAVKHIRESLHEQSPKTVWKTRLILVFLFLLVQMIPFGTIGYVAYRDLKIGKHNYV